MKAGQEVIVGRIISIFSGENPVFFRTLFQRRRRNPMLDEKKKFPIFKKKAPRVDSYQQQRGSF